MSEREKHRETARGKETEGGRWEQAKNKPSEMLL